MEQPGVNAPNVAGAAVKRRRSSRSRRRPDSFDEPSPSSTALPSDDAKGSSDETISGETSIKRKEFNLNQCTHTSSMVASEADKPSKIVPEDDGGFDGVYSNEVPRSGINKKRSSEGVLAPANWKSTTSMQDGEAQSSGQLIVALGGSGNESKVKKVKLKVGGVTRTVSASNGKFGPSFEGNSDHAISPSDKRGGLQGIPWKDFSRGGFSLGKEDSAMGRTARKNAAGKQGETAEPVRKSKRMPKKRVLDGDFDDEDDDEIRYLEKLRASRIGVGNKECDEDSGRRQRKLASVSDIERQGAFKAEKDTKRKSRGERATEDTEHEEEETGSDGDLEGRRKKQKKESIDILMDTNRREMTLTTRQRALQSSKDASLGPGSSVIEFPNGLPPAPPRKQKEKLSEVEQQLKKAEAAQRRRIQNEKAARESEAEAIRKYLVKILAGRSGKIRSRSVKKHWQRKGLLIPCPLEILSDGLWVQVGLL